MLVTYKGFYELAHLFLWAGDSFIQLLYRDLDDGTFSTIVTI